MAFGAADLKGDGIGHIHPTGGQCADDAILEDQQRFAGLVTVRTVAVDGAGEGGGHPIHAAEDPEQ